MRRILLLGLIGFVFSGCEEKKVTEDMLVGEWICDINYQVAKWKNGVFQDYAPQDGYAELFVKYLKKDDNLFVEYTDGDGEIKQDFNEMNGRFESFIGNMKIVGSRKLEYISDNEYQLIIESTRTYNKSEDNEKIKILTHCTRIK
ncbi:hypothetical protein JMI89_01910 [Frischella sp. Ac48]|uniref:Lipocalin-like domain-containing protein n=1 Tax=Frischella japonica TaxID=2741544 RepID=A0ABR7QZ07_9GAMM|nr:MULTISPECIES: hypothetical protein [Frischella]MBC9131325.1 hypothetical protein [Frischella japonica]MBX4132385.1 hypothetical protein [Frischella sp. Ac48]